MSRSVRARRIDAQEPLLAVGRPVARPVGTSLADRAGAVAGLDLGSRIRLADDLQGAAGNAATAGLLGEVRTDRRREPPKGVQEIMGLGAGGWRGHTATTRRSADMPLFRVEKPAASGGTFSARAVAPSLPSLDQEVSWPAAGRHLIRSLGKGNQYLDVTQDWSDRILAGENEHVEDGERAYDLTWGRVARVLGEMARGRPYTGASEEAVVAAAWADFRRRLPAAMRPDGDRPTREAQEARWGIDEPTSLFARMMDETRRVRDVSGWHTPLQVMKEERGADRIDELLDGSSKIPGPTPEQVMTAAWERLTKA